MVSKKRYRDLPVNVIMSLAIIISMLTLAAGLTSISYFSNRNTLVTEVEKASVKFTTNLNTQIHQLTESVQSTVKILEFDSLTSMGDLKSRKSRLPTLARIMRLNHVLSAVYVGYSNGDFFLLRTLKNDHAKEVLDAPENAAFMLQSIEYDVNKNKTVSWEFYDSNLALVKTSVPNEYSYDPRRRPWFAKAKSQDDVVLTSPYVFFSTLEVGTTFAVQNKGNGTVVGVDASITDISDFIHNLRSSSYTNIALVDQEGFVVGSPSDTPLVKYDAEKPRLIRVDELNVPALERLSALKNTDNPLFKMNVGGENWYGSTQSIATDSDQQWRILYTVPQHELLAEINDHLVSELLLSGLIILLLVGVGAIVGHSVSKPLRLLSSEVGALTSFDFSRKISVKSFVREVNQLSTLTNHMVLAIKNFQSISNELSRDPDLEKMLDHVCQNLVTITASESGAVFLCDESQKQLLLASSAKLDAPTLVSCEHFDWDTVKSNLEKALKFDDQRTFLAPLIERNNTMLGVLVLRLPANSPVNVDTAFQRFIEEVSGVAAAAISARKQFEAQQELMDAIMKLLADTIDAKSSYTSGHCDRVPELAELLAQAAIDASEGEFSDFNMTAMQRREFRIAAWLHDCGKITSDEHIIDKATKLETIHNRIHEIRTRFEVLWRDADVEYYKGLAEGKDPAQLERARTKTQTDLQDNFSFIANANMGAERMAAEDIQRVREIGTQTWERHFNRFEGLSHEELALASNTSESLPVTEQLLSDKVEHLVSWGKNLPPVQKDDPKNIWGFDMELPKYALNKGELYNLCVERGTLTNEERFAINDHMVQTIKMLSALPFPDELKNVPNIAGNHHEKMDGTGYPRRLSQEQLSIPERIMAIADVFEALTAADRPYKTAKTLSESMRILAFMVKDHHLDKDLFKLFITSKAYLSYAEKHLKPEQIDAVSQTQLFTWAGIEEPQMQIS
ncbi:HD domain-containing phosphohydrolase [Marinomonas balearica]|uniref:GAF domain-containing protein n=1 Tax=Marinomonas balearica TaxID=491947 RepID=A0A4R6M7I7_9GAMM|nr:HD domain-containing phosphohydrolase [Marinomonas balearica]TDO97377.1 GAF domain-containing protein [Marinomonas balearica]